MWKYICIVVLLALSIPARANILFDYGSPWKYKLGTAEASSPISAWRNVEFNDSTWSGGPTPIGYSTQPNNGYEESIVTVIPTSQAAGYLSVFMRKEFTINNPSAVSELTLNVTVDDAFAVWINGTLMGYFNLGDADVEFDSFAISAEEPSTQAVGLKGNLSNILRPGKNVVALQLFNANYSSSDIIIDASLSSDVDESAPTVVGVSPSAGAKIRDLTVIDVTFSETVLGVQASDLLVNGSPALSVEAVSPRNYIFRISQPADGTVNLAWTPNHGITDTAIVPNVFVGGDWSYTVDSTLPEAQVVISEFLASNENGERDEDGTRSDWIELFNMSNLSQNLGGWFLTDDRNNLTKWTLPGITLGPGNYLLVWASDKNRSSAGSPLHTNFKLAKSGSYLALVDSKTNVISSFGAAYPSQRDDISYGRDVANAETIGFFTTPTPGSRNLAMGTGFAPEPQFSHPSGVYTNNSISVTMTAPVGQIRYTTDGSIPTATSTLYTGPINVNVSRTIKARVFQNGLLPSEVIGRAYTLVDSTMVNFSSTLPVVIFNTSGRGIAENVQPGGARTFASVAMMDTYRGRSSVHRKADFLGYCELEVRGQTSSGFPKRPYNMELQNVYRFDEKAEILGFPEGSDFALINPYSDKPFLQNFLAYEIHEKMGHYAVRRRFVEVFLNTGSGKVNYSHYGGIYLLVEKIRADGDRVDIEELSPGMNSEPEISGGYIFKKDKDSSGDLNFYTSGGAGFSGQALKIHEPKPREVTPQQISWLENYLNQMERAMYANNWKTATGTNHYSHYLDVASFVDYHWIVEFAKQIDGYRISNYMTKDRGGKVKMEPIWDWNLSFGNADYLGGESTSGWYYTQLGDNEHIWLRRLINGTTSGSGTSGDPDFNQAIADRWSVLRTNILNDKVLLARIDEMAAILAEPAERDFARYPRLGQYVWPNSSIYVTPTTYAGIISAMKGWVAGRYQWIDSQFIKPPTVNHAGGYVPPGATVTLTGAGGTLYYTTDGTDPRVSGGGTSSKAQIYSAPITISSNSKIVARIRNGSRWSGPAAAAFTVQRPTIAITEIMYHPAMPPTGSPYTDEDFEYIELKNTGSAPVDLGGYRFIEGLQFTFTAQSLPAGERVLVVKNRTAFQTRYGTTLPIAGEFTGSLDNAGERISLEGSLGEPIITLEYLDTWEPLTDGPGFALVLKNENSSSIFWQNQDAWGAGSTSGGTPGAAEPQLIFARVVVNEVLANPAASEPEMVELHNLDSTSADVSGWWLSDNDNTPKKYRLPAGSVIPPNGFLTVSGANYTSAFNLSAEGEEIHIFSADANGNLTGYHHGFDFDATPVGVSIGRLATEDGAEIYLPETTNSFGNANGGSSLPSVVISEIMYRPADVFLSNSFWNNTEDEFIELWNRGSSPFSLFDTTRPTNAWRIGGAVTFTFPEGVTLEANSGLLIVSFDPSDTAMLTSFRNRNGVPASVPVYGPYLGTLPNSGGTISLRQPLIPIATGADAGTVPYLAVENIRYADTGAWPAGADGLGRSLSRKTLDGYGHGPSDWIASQPSPGTFREPAAGPLIVQHPIGKFAQPGERVTLSVESTGAGTLRYQWRFNGENLPWGTRSTLVLTNGLVSQSGEYKVVVIDTAGSTTSRSAFVQFGNDTDGDGILDEWEIASGANPYQSSDAEQDADSDGLSNLDEFLAGTDPLNPQSIFALNHVMRRENAIDLVFTIAPQRTYMVQYRDSLTDGVWQTLTVVSGQNQATQAIVSDSANGASRFYRLVPQF
ncbi:MAG: lamin tail domain-containing protein [Verrucomicrobiales bacterium]